MSNYDKYKTLWENTKPIRGRGSDVRPIDPERRDNDHKTVVRLADGKEIGAGVASEGAEVTYGAKLYNTVCVEYFPDGSLVLQPDGYNTPTTVEFINRYAPVKVFRAAGHMWARVCNAEGTPIQVPVIKSMRFVPLVRGEFSSFDQYKPVRPVLLRQHIVDRAVIRAMREPLRPFVQYVTTFLAMSDGWIRQSTVDEAQKLWEVHWAKDGLGWSVVDALHPSSFNNFNNFTAYVNPIHAAIGTTSAGLHVDVLYNSLCQANECSAAERENIYLMLLVNIGSAIAMERGALGTVLGSLGVRVDPQLIANTILNLPLHVKNTVYGKYDSVWTSRLLKPVNKTIANIIEVVEVVEDNS